MIATNRQNLMNDIFANSIDIRAAPQLDNNDCWPGGGGGVEVLLLIPQ